MAQVNTTKTVTAKSITWNNPSNIAGNESGIPIGLVTFKENFTVPSKLAVDTNLVRVICNLPRNFVYRPRAQWITAVCASTADANDFTASRGWLVRVNEDKGVPGTEVRCYYNAPISSGSITPAWDTIGATDGLNIDFVELFTPKTNIQNLLIESERGNSSFEWSTVDISSDITGEILVLFEADFLVYTTDALRSWRVNTPTLINGS